MLFFKANEREREEDELRIGNIPIDLIRPNPYQPRRYFSQSAIQELSNSIKAVGLIQPITVRNAGDHYELIAGIKFEQC